MDVMVDFQSDDDLRHIRFEDASRVHDWRNHVGGRVRDLWLTFTPEQRRALALDAEDRASLEEWD
jgi:hypothetical protein